MLESKHEELIIERIYPKGVKKLFSSDGNIEAVVSHEWGAQVLTGLARTGGKMRDIILPIVGENNAIKRHTVATDLRPDTINEWRQGETFKPGTTFLSFFREIVQHAKGDSKPPVHGSAGAPYKQYHVPTPAGETNHVKMIARSDRRDIQFFNDGERYQIEREVFIHAATNGNVGSIEIKTKLINQSGGTVTPPDAAEHLYLVGGAAREGEQEDTRAVLYRANGELIEIEGIKRTAPRNGNDIDTLVNSEELAETPGRVVFLPEGPSGHVVAVVATMQIEGADDIAVNDFFVYRFRTSDEWTAIEPVIRNISLNNHQSVTLDVTIQIFETLDEYQRTFE